MKELSELEKKLSSALYDIFPENDFVLGALISLENDKERQFLLDFIANNKEIDPSQIILLTLEMERKRDDSQVISKGVRRKIKVRYIGKDDPTTLRKGKVYTAKTLKEGGYGIVDESKGEYAFPPELFEVVEDDD